MPRLPAPPEMQATTPAPARVRWHWNSALVGALLSAIVFGSITLWWRMPTPSPITIHAPGTAFAPDTPLVSLTPTPVPTTLPALLMVFVSGAVQTPGVYSLPSDSRVVDAIERAGGLASDANGNAVNQAEPLRDGDQVHVPTMTEEAAAPLPGLSRSASVEIESGLIDINRATQEELERLPGIGPARAQDIIDHRPFTSVDDLDRVPGIGAATIDKLRPYVIVD